MALEWTRNGNEEVGPFLKAVSDPEELWRDFQYYKSTFGEEFTLEMYVKLQEVQANALIAKAIYDLPEYTMDQLFKAFNSGEEFVVRGSLDINGSLDVER